MLIITVAYVMVTIFIKKTMCMIVEFYLHSRLSFFLKNISDWFYIYVSNTCVKATFQYNQVYEM
jgi:hypothetical protein